MKPRRFTPNKDTYAGVYGTTLINHRIRCKLGLTFNEYVVADYLAKQEKGKITEETLWKEIGVHLRNIETILYNLHEKKIVVFNQTKLAEKKELEIAVTKKWKEEFDEKNYEEEFKAFWDLYGHVGNKENARRAYIKARKVVTHDHLLRQHQKYVRHLEDPEYSWKSKMHLSTWLNPDKRRFDDEYPAPTSAEIRYES